jgi:hypothetical protein
MKPISHDLELPGNLTSLQGERRLFDSQNPSLESNANKPNRIFTYVDRVFR